MFALQNLGNTTGEFDYLQPPGYGAFCVFQRFAMFRRYRFGKFVHIGFYQIPERKHDLCTPTRRCCRPGWKGFMCNLDRVPDLFAAGKWNLFDHDAQCRVVNIAKPTTVTGGFLTIYKVM